MSYNEKLLKELLVSYDGDILRLGGLGGSGCVLWYVHKGIDGRVFLSRDMLSGVDVLGVHIQVLPVYVRGDLGVVVYDSLSDMLSDVSNVEGQGCYVVSSNSFYYWDGSLWRDMYYQDVIDPSVVNGHIKRSDVHYTIDEIEHGLIRGVGVKTHSEIDGHIDDGSIHFAVGDIDHDLIKNRGVYRHVDIDSHINDVSDRHFESNNFRLTVIDSDSISISDGRLRVNNVVSVISGNVYSISDGTNYVYVNPELLSIGVSSVVSEEEWIPLWRVEKSGSSLVVSDLRTRVVVSSAGGSQKQEIDFGGLSGSRTLDYGKYWCGVCSIVGNAVVTVTSDNKYVRKFLLRIVPDSVYRSLRVVDGVFVWGGDTMTVPSASQCSMVYLYMYRANNKYFVQHIIFYK